MSRTETAIKDALRVLKAVRLMQMRVVYDKINDYINSTGSRTLAADTSAKGLAETSNPSAEAVNAGDEVTPQVEP